MKFIVCLIFIVIVGLANVGAYALWNGVSSQQLREISNAVQHCEYKLPPGKECVVIITAKQR